MKLIIWFLFFTTCVLNAQDVVFERIAEDGVSLLPAVVKYDDSGLIYIGVERLNYNDDGVLDQFQMINSMFLTVDMNGEINSLESYPSIDEEESTLTQIKDIHFSDSSALMVLNRFIGYKDCKEGSSSWTFRMGALNIDRENQQLRNEIINGYDGNCGRSTYVNSLIKDANLFVLANNEELNRYQLLKTNSLDTLIQTIELEYPIVSELNTKQNNPTGLDLKENFLLLPSFGDSIYAHFLNLNGEFRRGNAHMFEPFPQRVSVFPDEVYDDIGFFYLYTGRTSANPAVKTSYIRTDKTGKELFRKDYPYTFYAISEIPGTGYVCATNNQDSLVTVVCIDKSGEIITSQEVKVLDQYDESYFVEFVPPNSFMLAGGRKVVINRSGSEYLNEPFSTWYYLAAFEKSVSTKKIDVFNDVIIYPNPTSDFIFINSSKKIEYLRLIDNQGRTIRETDQLVGGQINISDLATGTYFIQLYSKDEIVIKKMIKVE